MLHRVLDEKLEFFYRSPHNHKDKAFGVDAQMPNERGFDEGVKRWTICLSPSPRHSRDCCMLILFKKYLAQLIIMFIISLDIFSKEEVMSEEILRAVEAPYIKDVDEFSVGDTVKVHYRIMEGEKSRIQMFQGTVIARKNGGTKASFTVRKLSGALGVERLFPLHSPNVVKVEKVRDGSVRRAKLYYLRKRKGKAARIREKRRPAVHR